MVRRTPLGVLLSLVSITTCIAQDASAPQGAELKGYMIASTTVDAFFKGLREGDLDAVMATVDVPWFHDGTKLLKTKEELRAILSVPTRKKEIAELKTEVIKVERFALLRGELNGDAGELLKQVAQDDDLVFNLLLKSGERTEGLRLFVRVQNGAAKIIGLRD